ncbi:MAG: ribonuclease D [bacterium]|nr:ribonuclease D [bacterium]
MQARAIRWIATDDELTDELGRVGPGPLGLDSEADSLHRYPEKVCLVQISHGGRNALIDPLAGVDMGRLGPLLHDVGLRKILHGADYDLRVLHRDFGLELTGLFDTMIAARLVGERAFGLAALLQKYLDVTLDKKHQRADWSRRPLSPALLEYAATDTRHLEALVAELEPRLVALGRREWAEEEFRNLEVVRWTEKDRSEAYRRVKGSNALDRRELALLRELFALREREARERGRPPFRVMPDAVLLALAETRPSRVETLGSLRGLPRGWERGRRAESLLQAVRTAEGLAQEELPPLRLPRERPRISKAVEERLKRLCKERDRIAEELDLEPSVVASRSALEASIARVDRGEEPGPPEMRGWQARCLRPAFDAL